MNLSRRWSALKSATTGAVLGLSVCLPVWAQNVPSLEASAELATRNGQPYLIFTLPELWISPSQKFSNVVVEVSQEVSLLTGQPAEVDIQLNDPSVKPFFELSDDRKTLRLPKVRYGGTVLHNVRLKASTYFPNVPNVERGDQGLKNVAIGVVIPGGTLSLATARGWPAAPVDEATFCSARYIWGVLDALAQRYGVVAGTVRYQNCSYSNGLGLIDITVELPGGIRATVPYVSFRWLN